MIVRRGGECWCKGRAGVRGFWLRLVAAPDVPRLEREEYDEGNQDQGDNLIPEDVDRGESSTENRYEDIRPHPRYNAVQGKTRGCSEARSRVIEKCVHNNLKIYDCVIADPV